MRPLGGDEAKPFEESEQPFVAPPGVADKPGETFGVAGRAGPDTVDLPVALQAAGILGPPGSVVDDGQAGDFVVAAEHVEPKPGVSQQAAVTLMWNSA